MLRLMEVWKDVLQQNVSLVCFKEGSDEIVGLNICSVSSLGDPDLHMEKVSFACFFVTNKYNCFNISGCKMLTYR